MGACPAECPWRSTGARASRSSSIHAETETTFDYLVALIGVFLLCVAQEHLFYFRPPCDSAKWSRPREDVDPPRPSCPSRTSASPARLSASGCCVPPFAVFDRPTSVCPSRARVPLARSRFSDRPPSSVPRTRSVPTARQRAAGTFLYGANLASSYLIMAGGDVVQRRRVFLGARRAERRAFFVCVKAPHRRGGGDLGGLPPRVLAPHAPGALTRRSR